MKLLKVAAILALTVLTTKAEAQKRLSTAHDQCNITFPCEGVTVSDRGKRVVRAMGGLGTARPVYRRQVEKAAVRGAVQVVAHPSGCPRSLFCGCGAAVRVFGRPIRELWLARAWFKFPRTAPAPGMVAVRSGHVFVLEAHVSGNVWQVYDANSGGRLTRIHNRSLAGYTVVNPRV